MKLHQGTNSHVLFRLFFQMAALLIDEELLITCLELLTMQTFCLMILYVFLIGKELYA